MNFSIFAVLYTHHPSRILEDFQHPQKKLCVRLQFSKIFFCQFVLCSDQKLDLSMKYTNQT